MTSEAAYRQLYDKTGDEHFFRGDREDLGRSLYDLGGAPREPKTSTGIIDYPLNACLLDQRVTITPEADLLGACFLRLTFAEDAPSAVSGSLSVYRHVERIVYLIGGEVIEDFSGRALEALATYDPRACASVEGLTVVYPLCLCTSASTHSFLPLSDLSEVTIRVVLSAASCIKRLAKAVLHVQHVLLLPPLDRERGDTPPPDLSVPIFPKTSSSMPVRTLDDGIACTAAMDLSPWLRGVAVRDLVVLLEPVEGGECSSSPLVDVALSFGVVEVNRMDSVMMRKVVPRHSYGAAAATVASSSPLAYFMPFDATPIAETCASFLRMPSDGPTVLRLTLRAPPGQRGALYVAHVIVRTANVLRTGAAGTALDLETFRNAFKCVE
jgi:hypothetical protein